MQCSPTDPGWPESSLLHSLCKSPCRPQQRISLRRSGYTSQLRARCMCRRDTPCKQWIQRARTSPRGTALQRDPWISHLGYIWHARRRLAKSWRSTTRRRNRHSCRNHHTGGRSKYFRCYTDPRGKRLTAMGSCYRTQPERSISASLLQNTSSHRFDHGPRASDARVTELDRDRPSL
jgi:hypothetical protein